MAHLLELALTNAGGALLLAVLAFAADRYLKRPSVAHLLWTVVMLRLLMPPLVNLPLLPATSPPGLQVAHTDASRLQARQLGPASEISPWWERLDLNPTTALVLAWVIGSIGVVGLTIFRMASFQRSLRAASSDDRELQEVVDEVAEHMGVARAPDVRVVEAPISPMVWAPFRSATLVVPSQLLADLEADELRTLVAHELAHLSRGDHRLRYVEQLAVAAFWWYPLAWLARKRLRRSEERCCDAIVTSILPGLARAYAKCLLKTTEYLAASGVKDLAVASGAAGVEELKERLTMIIQQTHPKSLSPSIRFALGALVVVALAVVPVRATTQTGDSIAADSSLITLDFVDTDVREVMRAAAKQAGLSIAFTPEVSGSVTVSVFNVPAAEALHAVLAEAGLEMIDDRGVLWVHPKGKAPRQVQQFTGEPISLTLQDADIREVLDTIASVGQLNIVVDSDVDGRCSVNLNAVPLDQALDVVVRSNGLAYETENGVVRVYRPDLTGGFPEGQGFRGAPISLNLEDAEIRDVLETFHQLTGLEYMVAPEVEARVTVNLEQVRWDQALDLILISNGLEYRLESEVLSVFPAGTR